MIRKIKIKSGLINQAEMISGKRYRRQANFADISTDYLDYEEISEVIGDLIVAATGHKMRENGQTEI